MRVGLLVNFKDEILEDARKWFKKFGLLDPEIRPQNGNIPKRRCSALTWGNCMKPGPPRIPFYSIVNTSDPFTNIPNSYLPSNPPFPTLTWLSVQCRPHEKSYFPRHSGALPVNSILYGWDCIPVPNAQKVPQFTKQTQQFDISCFILGRSTRKFSIFPPFSASKC